MADSAPSAARIDAALLEDADHVVGVVAAGALRFDNLLTVIAGYAETLLGSLAPSNPHVPDVLEIRRAAERA